MRTFPVALFACFLPFAVACGSTVVTSDGDGDDGAGAGEPGCDEGDRPGTGGGACPPAYECIDGAWIDVSGDCPEPLCPEFLPGYGEACDFIGQECQYEEFLDCGPGGTTVTATCTAEGWVTAVPRCQPEPECPDTLPLAGADCTGWDFAYSCDYAFENACGAQTAWVYCDTSLETPTWNVSLNTTCDCGGYDSAEQCGADPGCRWLVPGCSEPALPVQGCFPKDDCEADACGEGESCSAVVIDPCWNSSCDACGASADVCLPTP